VRGCLLLNVSVISILAASGRVLSARTGLPFFSARAALVASSRAEVALVVHAYLTCSCILRYQNFSL
jgi:hypothetical protein